MPVPTRFLQWPIFYSVTAQFLERSQPSVRSSRRWDCHPTFCLQI